MDALAPYEVFAAAGMYSGGAVALELVSAEGKRSVPSGMNGPALEAQAALDPNRPGIILVPGAAGKPAGKFGRRHSEYIRAGYEDRFTGFDEASF